MDSKLTGIEYFAVNLVCLLHEQECRSDGFIAWWKKALAKAFIELFLICFRHLQSEPLDFLLLND
jgi:hypothetical protein